jgi:predicted CXXCH cytochrome family protein
MKPSTSILIAAFVLACTLPLAAGAKPNILVLLADDLGYGELGVQGYTKDIPTPHIDSIAKNGVRFTQGYVSCPFCAPTRAGLLSGRYQQRSGFETNPGAGTGEANFGLAHSETTLAERLKSFGLATSMLGKWHLGFKPEMQPPARGFDEFFGFLHGAHPYLPGQGRGNLMRGTQDIEEPEYLTDAFAREAVDFIQRHATEPFFLYLPFNAVHSPLEAPANYLARFPDIPTLNCSYMYKSPWIDPLADMDHFYMDWIVAGGTSYKNVCQACHAPHKENTWPSNSLLRSESYKLCTTCHNATGGGKHALTPGVEVHHAVQEMFEGKGALEVGGQLSTHFAIGAKGAVCASCHMPGTATSADAMREMGDRLKQDLKSGVVVLGAVCDGKPSLLAMVTPDLVARGFNAGQVVKEVAKVVGGGGGGRAELGQGSGKDASKLEEALSLVSTLVERHYDKASGTWKK